MSRITFREDEDFNNQALMWEANQERSIKGRKGQAALRELERALLALPEKRLIANDLETAEGEVCAVGALAKLKGVENPKREAIPEDEAAEAFYQDSDPMEQVTIDHAIKMGVPKLVAVAIVAENDDYYPTRQTPEARYERMLRWVRKQLTTATA